MKITQVSVYYLPIVGGQEIYVSYLDRIFKDNGFDSNIIQLERTFVDKVDNVIFLPGYKVIGKNRSSLNWILFNFDLLMNRNLLKDSDLLISHYAFQYQVLKWHPKLIILSHGVEWRQRSNNPIDRYREYSAKLCKIKKVPIVSNDTHFLRSIGYDFPPAQHFFEEVDQNVWFIPNCVNTSLFFPIDIPRKPIILVPRNLRWSRGIHLAIEAFYHLATLPKYTDFTLVIAGGPLGSKYHNYCMNLVNNLGLKERVKFVGNISQNELIEYYNVSMVSLIPTLELEGTSLSALESMACGTPVISTKIGGLADLPTYKTDIDGKIMAKAIETVIDNWDVIQKDQLQNVIKKFTIANWENSWISVINQITKCS